MTVEPGRPSIHFSHANGFPAGCYHKLFTYLAPDYSVGAIEMIGHDPRYPVTDGWPHLTQQLIDHLGARYREPVIGVGHSLGGFLTFLAAIARPELFRAIVLMDSPVLGFFKSTALAMSKTFGVIDRVTPAAGTRGRRSHFPSSEAAYMHFRTRKVFKRFDPQCLRDYIDKGTVGDGKGVRLAFDPAIEYRIYQTIPHDLYRFRGALRVPAGFMVGRDSRLVSAADLGYMKRAFGMRFSRVSGGHLFPFQFPQETAFKLNRLIGRLGASATAGTP
ncbi:MAG: alpha/beta hydrolase [Acidobacteria bacterium]|nr:MAG: alpha/beta hydrolase [Acidobacteriota bacterium]